MAWRWSKTLFCRFNIWGCRWRIGCCQPWAWTRQQSARCWTHQQDPQKSSSQDKHDSVFSFSMDAIGFETSAASVFFWIWPCFEHPSNLAKGCKRKFLFGYCSGLSLSIFTILGGTPKVCHQLSGRIFLRRLRP